MLCNRRLPRPTRLPHLSRFSIASGLVVILGLVLGGCTDTTRPDTPPAPVVDRSISGERQPARTVSRASEVVPLQPPRAQAVPWDYFRHAQIAAKLPCVPERLLACPHALRCLFPFEFLGASRPIRTDNSVVLETGIVCTLTNQSGSRPLPGR